MQSDLACCAQDSGFVEVCLSDKRMSSYLMLLQRWKEYIFLKVTVDAILLLFYVCVAVDYLEKREQDFPELFS